jgi:signal transduction histidine kinase
MKTVKTTISQIIKRKESLLFMIIIIAGISLFGWVSGKLGLASFSLKYIPIPHSSAAVFIALSILFVIVINSEKSHLTKTTTTPIIIFIALFCLFIFLNFFLRFSQDIENVIVKNPESFGNVLTGRMSPITSLLFILICIGILGIRQHSSKIFKYISGSSSLLVCCISSVLLIGYLYKAPLLYGSRIIPVSLPSAICFLFFSVTLIRCFELKFWTFNLIKNNKITLQLLKLFLPIAIFMDVLHGFLITNFSIDYQNEVLFDSFVLLIIIVITIAIVTRVSAIAGSRIIRAEQALKENEKKLIQLNIDKDRFLSILGHDLRSPFNALLGLSDLLKDNIHNYRIDEIENIATQINKSAQISYNLLDDILTWVRTQSGKIPFNPQKLIFKDICKNIYDILKPNADAKNIRINYFIPDDINVYADIDMLKSVLRNLVSNAIKFTNIDGRIDINAEVNSGKVVITVSDNGIGINPDNLAKLFDISKVLTTTGTAEETGTGLGLLLCKEFVERHGGNIWVESQYGKGSEFKFTIP